MKRSLSKRGGEKGMATVLVMLLVGTAITATTLGTMYTLRSTQDTQRSLHANTGSEALAWNGVEMVRAYVQRVSEKIAEANASGATPPIADLSQLPARLIGSSSSSDEPISAVITQAYSASSRELTVQVTGRTSNASTTIEVVLQVSDAILDSATAPNKNLLVFSDGLDVRDGLIINSGDKDFDILVDGNARLGSLSLGGTGGLDRILATGSIELTSGSVHNTMTEVRANCDVKIADTGNPVIKNVFATQNICLKDLVNTENVKANGSIHTAGGNHIDFSALAGKGTNGTYCSSGAAQLCSEKISSTEGVKLEYPTITGSISSKKDITATDAKGAPSMQAEGKITDTGGIIGTIKAAGQLTITNSTINGNASSASSADTQITNATMNGDLISNGTIKITYSHLKDAYSAQSITFNGERANNLFANGNITLENNTITTAVYLNGVLNKPSWITVNSFPLSTTIQAGTEEQFTANLTEVPPVIIDKGYLDTNSLEAFANYVFHIEQTGGNKNIRVAVNNVSNIPETAPGAEYYLRQKKVGDNYEQDWLCNTATSSNNDESDCVERIGYWTQFGNNKTIDINNNGEWVIGGGSESTIAPGILFFKGLKSQTNGNTNYAPATVNIKTGTFYNVFISTGNISTLDGNIKIYSPNFIGSPSQTPAKICANPTFPDLAPTDFCDNGQFISSALGGLGNYSLLAGSCATYTGAECTSYSGGNISVGSNSTLYGPIRAGNQFQSSGSATIYGYISAYGLGDSTLNKLSASTTIDVSNPPEGFDPSGGNLDALINPVVKPDTVTVRWTRYL